MGFLGRGQPAPPHQLGGLRERCKLPQRGPGRSPGRTEGFSYSEPSDCLSQHLSTLMSLHCLTDCAATLRIKLISIYYENYVDNIKVMDSLKTPGQFLFMYSFTILCFCYLT